MKRFNNKKDLSDYDLETAIAMLDSKRYLYVGFMCHQAQIVLIAKKGEFYYIFTEDQQDFIDQLEPLNIET